jgi:2-keto-4-pentenoate hydratase/2-oxohepta-3-ene-1,7-dioic acid hydratase in catechol pathway
MYVEEMAKDLDHPVWRGQRPWFEIYFAVVVDESRRRAVWVRQTLFVPKQGDGRATIWAAWFDADASPRTRAAKRFVPLDQAQTGAGLDEGEQLIRIADSHLARSGAVGNVENLAWDLRWSGGKPFGRELPAWVPAPTHARGLVHDAGGEGTVTIDGAAIPIRGRALAMHLWGNRRVPTLHWIWAPWLASKPDDLASLEVTAVSLRDTFSLGLSSLALDGTHAMSGTPATAAHPHGLLTATVAGVRRLVHAHAWAEPDELVGYVYRDTDDRDLMVAQSDIGSAHLEVFARRAPGAPWHLAEERRAAGGVAVEIHQRDPLPGVDYIAWDATTQPRIKRTVAPTRGDVVEWPAISSIVALGLTYADHAKEAGQPIDKTKPPIAFAKHGRTFTVGDGGVVVPTSDQLLAALDELEPGLSAEITRRMAIVPAVMDYEGEIALVALDAIDDSRLGAGVAQPFGLVACNDLTARFCQVLGEGTARPHDYWAVAKSFDRFLPVAEKIWAPAEGLSRMPDITLVTRVNGEERQRSSTKQLAYDLSALVRAAKAQLGRPLQRGDVILTGTPAGVGLRLNRVQRRVAALVKDRFRKAELLVSTYATSNALLRPGDVVEIDAGPAGSVRTRLVV